MGAWFSRAARRWYRIRWTLRLLLWTAFVLTPLAAGAQSPAQPFAYAEPYFERVGDNDSVPYGTVMALAQDVQGFLWIGTQQGLIRYDGYRFRKFINDPADASSLPGNSVRSLSAAADGRLWIGTESDGLAVYEPQSERFTSYQHSSSRSDSLSPGSVLALASAADGGLWLATDAGLDYLGPGRSGFVHHRQAPGDAGSLADNRVRSLLLDAQDRLWVGTADGLQLKLSGQLGFMRVASSPGVPDSLAGQEIGSLLLAADGKLWLSTREHGVAWLDVGRQPGGGQDAMPNWLSGPVPGWITSISQPRVEQIWLASRSGGITVVAAADGRVLQQLRHDPAVASSLALNDVEALLFDRSGLLWIGCRGGGLQRHNPHNGAIKLLQHSPSRPEGLSHANVRSVLALANGQLLVGTSGNGIDIFDPQMGRIDGIRAQTGVRGALTDGDIHALAQTPDGALWAGSRQAGLFRRAQPQSPWQQFTVAQGLPDNNVRRLMVSRRGELMVGTAAGLARWHPEAQRFDVVGVAGSPLRTWISAIAEDGLGRIWLATTQGLGMLAPGASEIILLRHQPQLPASLSNDDVMGLLVDSKDRLWVDTAQGLDRLRLWDGQRTEFDHISALVGRPGLYFGANLLEDKLGRIWTQWYVLDPERMTLYELAKADGLDIGTAWIGSFHKTADGHFLYGGTLGLAIIEPEQFRPWHEQPPMVATELKIDGQPMPLGLLQPGLHLSARERGFSLEFAALDFSAPHKNRYRYRLQGYDRDWIATDAEHRSVSYGNLWPGAYSLELSGSNRLGAFSAPLIIPLTIAPAYWQTGWFVAALALLGAGLLYGAYRWQQRRAIAHARKLGAQVAARTADILKLSEIGRQLTATLEPEQVFERIYQHISARLEAQVCSLGFYDLERQCVRIEFSVENGVRQPVFSYDLCEAARPAVWCVQQRRELIVSERSQLSQYVDKILPVKQGQPMESIVYLPLLIEQRVIGCLSVQSPRINAYNTSQLEFLRVLASYTAISLANAHAHAALSLAHRHLQDTQQQLLLQEKMAGLGTLTAGVAHEINNPTNFAHVAAQNLRVDLQAFEKFLHDLLDVEAAPEMLAVFAQRFALLNSHVGTILNGSERIKAIVKDLRTFTRGDSEEKQWRHLADGLRSTLSLVRTNWREQVDFVAEFIDDPLIECWPALLNQVFMNLIVNGCQAIAQRQAAEPGAPGRLRLHLFVRGPDLVLEVEDSGIGIAPENISKIFEPFYTTKAVGEGTGLGLAISYNIAVKHQGTLTCRSQPGQGSCFVLTLPLPAEANKNGGRA